MNCTLVINLWEFINKESERSVDNQKKSQQYTNERLKKTEYVNITEGVDKLYIYTLTEVMSKDRKH